MLFLVVDKSRNMEHPGTFRNIPEHRIIMIIMTKYVGRTLEEFFECSPNITSGLSGYKP